MTWCGAVVVGAVLAVAGARAGAPQNPPPVNQGSQTPPTFSAGVDLVALDVQVVDKNGTPIPRLNPDKFTVTIDGRRRKVVSADFIESAPVVSVPSNRIPSAGPIAVNNWPVAVDPTVPTTPGRLFVLAVDLNSFDVGESRGMVSAARQFLDRLQPQDQVGLYTFPVGPKMDPTTDHVAVARQLDTIVGQQQTFSSEYNLTPSEVVDINAEAAKVTATLVGRGGSVSNVLDELSTLRRVQQRECASTDVQCIEMIQTEASALGFMYEGQVTESLNGLRGLLRQLSVEPGRKTVVVVSAGMAASDRPGGRPNVDDLANELGRDAARSNSTIYALHIDASYFRTYSAEARKVDRNPSNHGRELAMLSRVMDVFSGASGGALMQVTMGSGEMAFERVLRETSSHYLLGVEPTDIDRDGRIRALKVTVGQSGATVRSRTWVVVPKRTIAD